jgi:hypothetical protein
MSNSKQLTKDKSKMDKKDDDAVSYTTSIATKNIEWSIENELMLVEWCDIAQCYRWLNQRSHRAYSIYHAWFTIPTITLSTITGTASFAQSTLPIDYQGYAQIAIGTTNILIGVLNTIQQYLKISELKESHRIASIAWDKYARNIRIELSKAPTERMDAAHFLKLSRQEYDRLMESSPSIPLSITKQFKHTFSGKPGSEKQKIFDDLKKPDICDSLMSSNQCRHHWYLQQDDINGQESKGLMDTNKEPPIYVGSGKHASEEKSTIMGHIEGMIQQLMPNYIKHPTLDVPTNKLTQLESHTINMNPSTMLPMPIPDISFNTLRAVVMESINPFDLSYSFV